MGYQTEFEGQYTIHPEPKEHHIAYINKFSETRRMKRNANICIDMYDPVRAPTNLPPGLDGAYFVGGKGYAGQDNDASVLDHNIPPDGQWIIKNNHLVWDGNEKFYDYVEWLEYLIKHFFEPWGYKLNGSIDWIGEDSFSDQGTITVKDNKVTTTDESEENDALEELVTLKASALDFIKKYNTMAEKLEFDERLALSSSCGNYSSIDFNDPGYEGTWFPSEVCI